MTQEPSETAFPVDWDRLAGLMELDIWREAGCEASFQSLLGLNTQVLAQLESIAKDYLTSKRSTEAADAYFFLVILNPLDSQLWLRLGNAEQQRGELEDAIQAYQMAALFDPYDPFPYLYMAQCMRMRGEVELAIECYDTGIQLIDETQEHLVLRERMTEERDRLKGDLQ